MKTLLSSTAPLLSRLRRLALVGLMGISLSGMALAASGNQPKPAIEISGGINEELVKNTVQNQLNEKIGYPAKTEAETSTGKVNFIFRITDRNQVEILDIYGDNDRLVAHVEKAIDGFFLRYDSSLQGKAYRMVIDFKGQPKI